MGRRRGKGRGRDTQAHLDPRAWGASPPAPAPPGAPPPAPLERRMPLATRACGGGRRLPLQPKFPAKFPATAPPTSCLRTGEGQVSLLLTTHPLSLGTVPPCPRRPFMMSGKQAFCVSVSFSCGLGAGQMNTATRTRERWEGTRTPRCKMHARRKATLAVLGLSSVGVEPR